MAHAADEPDSSELTALMDASAAVLGLDIEPEWRPIVLSNLETALRFARLVAQFPVPDTTDPANMFRLPAIEGSSADDST